MSHNRADGILNSHYRGSGTGTTNGRPAGVYLALLTGPPDDSAPASGQPEVVAGATGYTRQQLLQADGTWDAPINGANGGRLIANTVQINFADAADDYAAPITHWMLVDTASGEGNVLDSGALSSSEQPVTGGKVFVAAGDLTIEYT